MAGPMVIDCFSGIATARLALHRLGVKPDLYLYSEVDDRAISVIQQNFPDCINLGDLLNISVKHYERMEDLPDSICNREILHRLNESEIIVEIVQPPQSISRSKKKKPIISTNAKARTIRSRSHLDYSEQVPSSEFGENIYLPYGFRLFKCKDRERMPQLSKTNSLQSEFWCKKIYGYKARNVTKGESSLLTDRRLGRISTSTSQSESDSKATSEKGSHPRPKNNTIKTALQTGNAMENSIRDNRDRYNFHLASPITAISGQGMTFYFTGVFDLLIGSPPCQAFSISGKREGFKDPEGEKMLYFINFFHQTPKRFFLMENVSMPLDCIETISNELGSEPYWIDSMVFSAQRRLRCYWTNIPVDCVPLSNSPLVLKDILEPDDLDHDWKDIDKYTPDLQKRISRRIKPRSSKAYTLCKNSRALGAAGTTTIQHPETGLVRMLTVKEMERLQTLPDGYTASCKFDSVRRGMIGNAFTCKVIEFLLKNAISG